MSSSREPRAARDEQRPPAHCTEGADRAVDAAGKDPQRAEKRARDFEMRMPHHKGHEDTKDTKDTKDKLTLTDHVKIEPCVLVSLVVDQRFLGNRARGLARVVRDDDVGAGAPNRRHDSSIARRSSARPFLAAAFSIEYSPLT